MSNFTNTLLLTFSCKNSPMKYNRWTLSLCLVASDKKYFIFLMGAVGDQVPPTSSLFQRSPLTTIINFNLSRLPSDWVFAFYTSMHVNTGSSFFGYSTRNVWLLIRFLISCWFGSSQGLFLSSEIFVTSKIFWVLECNGKLLNHILPKVVHPDKSLSQ